MNQKFAQGLYLAFDYGERYIGVAKGHSQIGTSSPEAIISNNSGSPDFEKLDKIIEQWLPVGLVVGIPVHMDGTEQALTPHARGFRKKIAKRYNIPAYGCDERMTTRNAAEIIKSNRNMGKRRKTSKADLDKIAAALILQKWFENDNELD